MKSKEQLRSAVKTNHRAIVASMNAALRGEKVESLKGVLARIGRGHALPHWYEELKASGTLPNLDGKTIGSVIEMVLVGILESGVLKPEGVKLRINPARGVDLPDLDLGIKSPSQNYCTSEPFFSAYERLYGSDHDVLVLLTDYQEKKKKPPLRLQITNSAYLEGSELADRNLCLVAAKHRDWLLDEDEVWTKKFFKFLAYVNQSDWLGKQLLKSFSCFEAPEKLREIIDKAAKDFEKQNQKRLKESKLPIPEEDLDVVKKLTGISPVQVGIIDAADSWVASTFEEAARLPNSNEWERLKKSPLNGKIRVSPALQWRYNFGCLFEDNGECAADADEEC
jgi:hypothetical protein